jgi:[ribosomal protein S5]-alanine N-acetyltransferase
LRESEKEEAASHATRPAEPPMRILETERLIIRHLRADDLDSFYEICRDPEVMKYVGDGQPLSGEQVQRWIQKSQENYATHGLGCFALENKADGRLIGYCGLINPDGTEAEIVYVLEQRRWRQGLAGEAAKAMLDFGFAQCGLRCITASIDPDNPASIRIVEKLGMEYRQSRLDEHGLPECVYSIECDRPAAQTSRKHEE